MIKMVLKNYYRLLAITIMSDAETVPYQILQENENFYMTSIDNVKCVPNHINHPGNYYITSSIFRGDGNVPTNTSLGNYNGSLVIGSGTTEATMDDYCLEAEITNLTKVSHIIERDNLTDSLGFELKMIKKYVNETSGDIIIGEVGYFQRADYFFTYNGSTWSNSRTKKNILLVREVLDEPLVVPAGQGATVTLNITFNGFEVLSSASATTE